MFLKNIDQTKTVRSAGFSLGGLIWVVIIGVALTLTGCATPNISEPEPEIAPAETEEIIIIERVEAIATVEPGSSLAIRKSAGTKDKPEDDVLDRVSAGRVLKIINKHEDSLFEDGYTWWEVEDTLTGIIGWSAAKFLEEIK